MLYNAHEIIIDRGIGAPGNKKYVVDGLNAMNKRYLSTLMKTVQLINTATRNSQMVMHT